MLGFLDFFILLFWISLGLFFFNTQNFITILLYSELTWLILFVLSTLIGAQINEIVSMSFTFFILGFGGMEFVIGLMLVVLMKNMQIGLNNSNSNATQNIFSSNETIGNISSKKWNF